MSKFEKINPTTAEPEGIFDNKRPREAALKVANRGETRIYLREVDSKNEKYACTIHVFTGKRAPSTRFLPLTSWRLDAAIKAAGKVIPPELNAKGKEPEYIAAGFKAPFQATVKKLGILHVPKIPGNDLNGCIKNFWKTAPVMDGSATKTPDVPAVKQAEKATA